MNRARPAASFALARSRLALVAVVALGACGGRGVAGSTEIAASKQPAEALPFSLCSAYGAAGTPCYPTTADRAGRPVAACRDPHRGRCESRAGRAVCLLAVASDGRACTAASGAPGQCQDGRCVEPR